MMSLLGSLKPQSSEGAGLGESMNRRTEYHDVEDVTGLAITSTPAHEGTQYTSDHVAVADIDLVDVLSGCMENQADADQLAAGLLEMEDELKALTDDDTSFLQFPSILQELFSPQSPNSEDDSLHNEIEATTSILPSVSEEYLHPKAQTEAHSGSEDTVDHQAISQHPLLPLISSILQERICQMGEPVNASKCASLVPRLELDAFMRDAVSQAIQLSKDKDNIGTLMQSIDNEGSYFTSEMSMFCQNLLQPDPTPSSASSQQIRQHNPSQQLTQQNLPEGKLAKENKPKSKPGVGKKCARLSQRNTRILREWLLEHADNPFPTDSEKDVLCLRTGLTLSKLTTWFVNSRRRILAPLGLKNYHKELNGLKEN